MKKNVTVFIVSLVVLFACDNNKKQNAASEKPIAVVSIIPFKYFADKIGGDFWNVVTVIPPGANHTNYDPTVKELQNISKAEIYFETSNIGFEDAWTQRFKSISSNCVFYNLSKNIELIGGHYHDNQYHGADPHYWLSAKDAAIISQNITEAFIKADSENKNIYVNNLKNLLVEINEIDEQLQTLLKPIKNKMFLIYHPALTYYAKDYDLIQIAIEDHGKEPSASYMANLIDLAKNNNIKTIFYQLQYTGQSVNTIAKEIGAKTVCFDPMAYNWSENMISIANNLLLND